MLRNKWKILDDYDDHDDDDIEEGDTICLELKINYLISLQSVICLFILLTVSIANWKLKILIKSYLSVCSSMDHVLYIIVKILFTYGKVTHVFPNFSLQFVKF